MTREERKLQSAIKRRKYENAKRIKKHFDLQEMKVPEPVFSESDPTVILNHPLIQTKLVPERGRLIGGTQNRGSGTSHYQK